MAYRDLLVIVDDDHHTRERISHAADLATWFNADLTGLCVSLIGEPQTRAAYDAMPLLGAASTVTVLTVDPAIDRQEYGAMPGADIALHLARHGVSARIEKTISAGISIGDVLLSCASDVGADLLVMGAYGHSRVRELVLGGATRTVLKNMTQPVLMSH